MESVFVPWSQSRNKNDKYPSLNWKVTIKYNGKEVLTTDYMSGCGHCPSYSQRETYESKISVKEECEKGIKVRTGSTGLTFPDRKKPILPNFADVMYSLVMDSEAFEYDFEDWCGNFGYETDSRKAEKIYNECQEIALKLIRVIGTDGLQKLRDAYQDY